MDRDNPTVKGWRSWRFNFGCMDIQIHTTRDSQLEQDLQHHIEELAYGGYSERHPHLDEIDEAN